jgi:hypothetical protein
MAIQRRGPKLEIAWEGDEGFVLEMARSLKAGEAWKAVAQREAVGQFQPGRFGARRWRSILPVATRVCLLNIAQGGSSGSCFPRGRSVGSSSISGARGSEMRFSSFNHLPRSRSYSDESRRGRVSANQSPAFRQVGHLTWRSLAHGWISGKGEPVTSERAKRATSARR